MTTREQCFHTQTVASEERWKVREKNGTRKGGEGGSSKEEGERIDERGIDVWRTNRDLFCLW